MDKVGMISNKSLISELDGADYGVGAVEEAQATSYNTLKGFSKLCDILIQKELLTLEELNEIKLSKYE